MIRTGEWLKKRREEERYTRPQLSQLTGVSVDMIKSIEMGRRDGSLEIWEALNAVLDTKIELSYDCEELIQEILMDIDEYGPECKCLLYYGIDKDLLIFTDYALEEDLKNPDGSSNSAFDIQPGECQMISTLQQAFFIFEHQNKFLQ